MSPDDYTTEDISVEKLIDAQRKCSVSPNPFERVVGALLTAARLQEKLAMLPNEALGRLMFDFVWNVVDVFSPELAICQAATERLINSSSVVKTERESVSQ